MTLIPPNVELVGDIGHFALFPYGSAVWTLYLRQTGALELHQGGAGVTAFQTLDVRAAKKQVSAVGVGATLFIVWAESNYNQIYLSKWDLALGRYLLEPTLLWAGTSPSITRYNTTQYALSYIDPTGQHVARTSSDAGASWSSPFIVDNTEIVYEVDIDGYPWNTIHVYWDETSVEDV